VLAVTQLEEDLTEAALRLLQARTQLAMARISLHRSTGGLLERAGVVLDGDLTPRPEDAADAAAAGETGP
jgi:hypothetical protein